MCWYRIYAQYESATRGYGLRSECLQNSGRLKYHKAEVRIAHYRILLRGVTIIGYLELNF